MKKDVKYQPMDIKQIKKLIKLVEKSSISEFEIEEDNVKIGIKKGGGTIQVQQNSPIEVPSYVQQHSASPSSQVNDDDDDDTDDDDDEDLTPINSPMVGTFYASPNPESPAFVKVGDSISKGDVVCIVEAMKLFNEIEAECSGTIAKILVENGTPVEYGQPLFLIK